MFVVALMFLVIALAAGILGFSGVGVITVDLATIIFVAALALVAITTFVALVRGRSSRL